MFNTIIGNWHIWQGTQFMVSYEDHVQKCLLAFPDSDAAINYLFTRGHKEIARSLHKEIKSRVTQ